MSQSFLPITNYPTVNGLALDYFTPGPTQSPDEVRGDSQVAFSIEPVIENPPGSQNAFSPDFDASDTFSMGIGNFDTAPTGGTMSLTANGSSSGLTAITYNQSAATLQTALNAAITAGGGGSATALCTATLIKAGVYLLVGTTNAAVSTGFFGVTSAALLTPISTATFYEESLGSASTPYRILLVVVQSAMCYAEATTPLADPDASLSVVQAGSGTTNRIQNLSFTPGVYQAQVTISADAGGTTATCGTISLGMSVTQVGSVLAQHPEIEYNNTDGVTPNNISITPINNGWNFEFIGTFGNSSANTLSLTVQDVSGPMGKSGVIDYNTVALLLYSYTQTGDSFTLKRQIVRSRSDGEVRTIYISDVTIDKSLLNPATAVPTPVASYYTSTQVDTLLALKANVTSQKTGETLWVDSVYGNDGTGTVERTDLPFLTLGAAKTAASSGDLVYVRPGTYSVTASILKNGVNWHFEPGATVNKTNGNADTSGILDDGGSAMTCVVTGEGDFLLTVTATDFSTRHGTVHVSHASSSVNIHARSIGWTSGASESSGEQYCVSQLAGLLLLDVSDRIYNTGVGSTIGGYTAVWWSGGNGFVRAPRIYSTANAIEFYSLTGAAADNFYVHANDIYQITTTGAAPVHPAPLFVTGNVNSNAAGWVVCDTLRGLDAFSIISSATDIRLYVTATKMFGAAWLQDGLNYITAEKIESLSNTGVGDVLALFLQMNSNASPTVRWDVRHHDPKAFTGLSHVVSGGSLIANGVEYTSGSGSDGVSISSGTVRFNNGYLNTVANNAGNPTIKSGGVLIFMATVLVAESGRDSISAATSQNVVAMSSWANKAVDSDVTITITGGLLVDSDVI